MYGRAAHKLLGSVKTRKRNNRVNDRTEDKAPRFYSPKVHCFALHPLFVFEQFLLLLSFSPFVQATPHKKTQI